MYPKSLRTLADLWDDIFKSRAKLSVAEAKRGPARRKVWKNPINQCFSLQIFFAQRLSVAGHHCFASHRNGETPHQNGQRLTPWGKAQKYVFFSHVLAFRRFSGCFAQDVATTTVRRHTRSTGATWSYLHASCQSFSKTQKNENVLQFPTKCASLRDNLAHGTFTELVRPGDRRVTAIVAVRGSGSPLA